MQWNHHKVLATAKVVKLFREKGYDGSVGCILNPEVTYPRSRAPHDERAAEMYDLFYNRVFLDPLVHGRYPQALFTLLAQHQVQWDYTADELALIADNTVDELGINLYYPHRVKAPSRAAPGDAVPPGVLLRAVRAAGAEDEHLPRLGDLPAHYLRHGDAD